VPRYCEVVIIVFVSYRITKRSRNHKHELVRTIAMSYFCFIYKHLKNDTELICNLVVFAFWNKRKILIRIYDCVKFLQLLCTMYFELCILYYVLCTLYYVLCTMYFILCTMYFVLCTLYFVLCTLYFVLCTLKQAVIVTISKLCYPCLFTLRCTCQCYVTFCRYNFNNTSSIWLYVNYQLEALIIIYS